MITLSATLLAEQKKATAVPYVELKAKENMASVTRYRWTRYYTGAEAITRHAATVPVDNSLIRARIVANGGNWDLSYSRVASPGSGSTYSSWNTLISTISNTAGLALASFGARVILVYVDAAGTGIYCLTSADNGATFGAETLVDTALASVTYLAVTYRDANTIRLFYATSANIVYTVEWTLAGGWGARAAWTNTATTITGLAARYYQDYNLALSGTDATGDSHLWQCIYGDGYSEFAGVWGALKAIMSANTGTNVAHQHVSLTRTDAFRLIHLELFTGAGAYTIPMATHGLPGTDYDDNLWREPWPLNITCSTGVVLSAGSTSAWLTTPNGVWCATPVDLDLTANLLSVRSVLSDQGGRLIAEVDNSTGTYLETASGKGEAWIGCELRLGQGYHTSAGNEVSTHLSYWVTGYELTAEPGKTRLILYAVSPWEILEAWRSDRQIAWAAGDASIKEILQYVLARVGFKLSLDNASGQLSTVMPGFTITPAFTIKPGESAATAVRRLMDYLTDGVRFQNATAVFTDRTASDASVYTLGTTHAIKSARYHSGHRPPLPNRAQVNTNGAFGLSHDWTHIELQGAINRQELVLNLTTETQADTHASALLRQATIAAKADQVTIPPSCGLELNDVVDLTDSRAGLSAAKRRVTGIAIAYDTAKPKFEQELTLGGL
ncbi:MAG: hypothetical protein HYX94_10090 [Chloroflexi bacterium]|nr:hypothetical protein [Chloroflexota bacterium]